MGINVNAEAPAISIIHDILLKAYELRASDIHFEPLSGHMRVRLRIDGLLYDMLPIEQEYTLQVIARIKVLAHMNVSECRIPQDGKLSYTMSSRELDLRVATFPCVYGEKVVIRLLDRTCNMLNIDNIGLSQDILDELIPLLAYPRGFFLVTGPTGSGKTTTLHAFLSSLYSEQKNIVTLEDPIEYYVESITQAQIYPEIGFTFTKGIKALLRQDPDVIMVGEIRDMETAQVAVQAALTGHLVLSTLHTGDTVSTLVRLLDMGIEPFLLNASLTGILSQRLARVLCASCKKQKELTAQENQLIKNLGITLTVSYAAAGCDACMFTGYKGRTGIFEFLIISHELRALLATRPVFNELYSQALQDGLRPLMSNGVYKVNQGIISLFELARVVL